MKFKIKSLKFKIVVFFILLFPSPILYLPSAHAEFSMENVEIALLEGKYEKAADEAEKLIDARVSRQDELYYIKGLSELKTARFKKARQSFEKILSKYQRSTRTFDAHVGIGDSFFLAGETTAALQAYKEALDKFPNDKNIFVPLYRIGNCYDKLGETGSAKRYYDKAESSSSLGFETMRRFGPSPAMAEIPKIEPAGPHSLPLRRDLAANTAGLISVQVGSFKEKRNADRLARKLSRAGYDSYIETSTVSGEKLYRVRVGRLKSMEEARSLEFRLRREGYKTKICGNIYCMEFQ